MKYIAFFISLALLLTLMPVSAQDALQNSNIERRYGNWIITQDTIIENETLVVEGSIFIKSGGLYLINSTLSIDSYENGQFWISVENGTLSLLNSTLTANKTENHYYVVVKDTGFFKSVNSMIECLGFRDGMESGLYVEGSVQIYNSTLSNNYCPLWVHRGTDVSLSNVTVTRNTWGMTFVSCHGLDISNITVENNYGTGIWLQNGSDNTVRNCGIKRIYSHGTAGGQGIIIDNETHDIIMKNVINISRRAGILIKGDMSNNNTVKDNVLLSNGVASIHLMGTSYNQIFNNSISRVWHGIMAENSDNNRINEDNISSKGYGIKVWNSNRTFIINELFYNISSYGIMSYYSNNTYVLTPNFGNVGIYLYLKNSTFFINRHVYSENYRIYGSSKLYLCKWVKVEAHDHKGNPLKYVSLYLFFMGEKIEHSRTSYTGVSSFYAPYALHTSEEKKYSWCEIEADGNFTFEENPIRFYSWETNDIVFREAAPELNVSVSVNRYEVVPGDVIEITVKVNNRTGPVDNATVDIALNGKPIFPLDNGINGTYEVRIKVPEFISTLKIQVNASVGDEKGSASTTLVRPPVIYEQENPEKTGNHIPWNIVVPALSTMALLLILVLFVSKKRPKNGKIEGYKPISPDKVEIEK